MLICPLTFTKNERTRLYELYERFVKQMESGKRLLPEFYHELKQTLKELLQQQKPLQNGKGHNHVHITHKDKAILNLPWQMAVDDPAIYLSKGLPVTGSLNPFNPQAGPLRILVMIASPEDLDHSKRLSYEEEEQVILKTLAPLWQTGQVQVEFTEAGSLQSLQAQLEVQHYHILYFSGHGIYKDNTGYLYLEHEEALTGELVTAQQLGEVIKAKPAHTPTLVILSACQTGQGEMKEGLRGIADELMYTGVPAVMAMAFSIRDDYAILFAGHLYQHLATQSSLGQAYAKAIAAMREQEQQELTNAGQNQYNPSQWLIPQFYCSQEVVEIVDWQAPARAFKVGFSGFIGGEEFLLLSPDAAYRFIGRRKENAFLFSKLNRQEPVLIKGQGGVGKTALAEHLAKRLISQDPSRYCFAFNETNTSITEIADRLQQYLQNEDKLGEIAFRLNKTVDAMERLELLLQQVSRVCKPFWIFDNIESFQAGIGGPLKEEYQGWLFFVKEYVLHRFPAIFTGRYPMAELGDVAAISLNQVSFVDYYRKCLQLSIAANPDINGQSDLLETASLLYDMLGGSYRLLEFFDELNKNNPSQVQELVKEMRLLSAIKGYQKKKGKEIVIKALLQALTEEELATFHLLLHFGVPVLQQALNMQVPGKQLEAHLQRLKDLTLIEEHRQKSKYQPAAAYKYYYITQLVRGWLQEYPLPPVQFDPECAGDYFEYVFKEISPTYGNKEGAFYYYLLSKNITKINGIGAQIVSEYYQVGLYNLVLHFGKITEEITGVQVHEEVLNNLGLTNLKFGRFDLALSYLTKFMIATRRMGDKEKEIIALNSISQVYYQQQDFDSALEWLEKCRQAARDNDLQESEALTLSNIGNIYADRNQFENALQVWRQSLQIRKTTGNRVGQIRVMISLSSLYTHHKEFKKALQMMNKGLAIAVEAGEKQLQCKILSTIGGIHLEMGAYGEALPYLQKAVAVSRSIDDQEGTGEALATLGIVYEVLENYDEAVECIVEASTIMQRFGLQELYIGLTLRLGRIEIARKDFAAGIATLESCLATLSELDNPEEEAQTLIDLGEACLETGAFDKALEYLQQSRALWQLLYNEERESWVLMRLSQAYSAKNDLNGSLKCLEERLVIQEETDDLAGQALSYFNMASIYEARGDEATYLKYLTKAYTMNKKYAFYEGIYFTGGALGFYLASGNEPDRIKKGLAILKHACDAGKQLGYAGIEKLTDEIKRLTERYNEVLKKGTKATKAKTAKK